MKTEITAINKTQNHVIFEEIQNWDICNTTSEVYHVALKEYGRCVSKIYIDNKDGSTRHVGWVFKKKCRYGDANESYINESYIQETRITPLKSYKIKHIKEYAL